MDGPIDYSSDDTSDATSDCTSDVSSICSDDGFIYSDSSDSYEDDELSSNASYSSNDSEINDPFGSNIVDSLIVWALNFGISHNALTALLQILRRFGLEDELPKHAKTLLNTPRTRVQVRECHPGTLTYFGIESNLTQMNDNLFENTQKVLIDIFIDGFSSSKSSKWEIWPVMGSLVGHMNSYPFLIEAYAGPKKPSDVDDYLKELADEITALKDGGVKCGISNSLKDFDIRCFICDAPAASFVTGRKSHASENGCPKCDQICGRDGGRLLYQNYSGNLRTDESFVFRLDPNHHRPQFLENHSVLEKAGIGMVSQFIIEPMHNADLGNTFKIIKAIIKNQSPLSHLSTTAFNQMNERFQSFYEYTPSEFERKPRTLNELQHFKANELRQILLYTFPVMLKGFVCEQLYGQVMLYHVAIRLLQDPNDCRQNVNAARQFINLFVLQYSASFGIKNFTYNTHCLLHIPDCVEEYGQLYSFSAYKGENQNRILKKLIRKHNLHLQQFSNRFAEISNARELLENAGKRGQFQYNNFILKPNSLRDSCCMVKPGIPIIITCLRDVDGTQRIRGRRFLKCENFYEYPVGSMENLGIILASQLSMSDEEFPINTTMDHLITKKWIIPKPYHLSALSQSAVSSKYKPIIIPAESSTLTHFSQLPDNHKGAILDKVHRDNHNGISTSSTKFYKSRNQQFISTSHRTANNQATSNLFESDISKIPNLDIQQIIYINGKQIPVKILKIIPPEFVKRSTNAAGFNDNVASTSKNDASIASSTSMGEASSNVRRNNTSEMPTLDNQIVVYENGKKIPIEILKEIPPVLVRRSANQSKYPADLSATSRNVPTFHSSTSTGELSANVHRNRHQVQASTKNISFTTKSAIFSVESIKTPNISAQSGKRSENLNSCASADELSDESDQNDVRMVLKRVNKKLDKVCEYINKGRKKESFFSFPINTKKEVEEFEEKILLEKARQQLVFMLKKIKRRTKENVLGELMSFLFTPELIDNFNLTGRFNQGCFKKLKIYKILQDVTKVDVKTHKIEVTRALHNMHQQAYNKRKREKKKKELEEGENDSNLS